MHEYDIALKTLLQRSALLVLKELTGKRVTRWINVELPRVQNPRVDLMGETSDGDLVQIELQSGNQAGMEHRMAEYYLAVHRRYGRYPRQFVVYVGQPRLRMKDRLNSPTMDFHYRLIDIRDLNGERLLTSRAVADNILALLTRLGNRAEAIRQILTKIAGLSDEQRETELRLLLLISGLRSLESRIVQEIADMPVLADIMDHKVFGPKIRKAKKEGRAEGELRLVRRMIEKRFGALPPWAEERLLSSSVLQLERIGLGLLDAKSLEALLKS